MPAKVLMVEDSVTQRRILRAQLESQGYEVVEGATGEEAERLLREEKPDVVLLDWELPDTNGPDLLSKWSKESEFSTVPVLMLTSYVDPEHVIHALDCGAMDYIRKPPEKSELFARLRTALRIKRLQDKLHETSIKDPLTGLYNRRYLDEVFVNEFTRSRRYGRPFACVLIDIDYFKQTNDTHGHTVGDEVLKQVAQHLLVTLRTSDTIVRYGGEEFLVLLPEISHKDAFECIDRLRLSVERNRWGPGSAPFPITISAGVAVYPETNANNPEELISIADKSLYRAKAAGRNKVVLANGESSKK